MLLCLGYSRAFDLGAQCEHPGVDVGELVIADRRELGGSQDSATRDVEFRQTARLRRSRRGLN